jgi:hypothetical protein
MSSTPIWASDDVPRSAGDCYAEPARLARGAHAPRVLRRISGVLERGAPVDEDEGVSRLLLNHLERYPQMTVQDVYKLLFQAAMGAEHAVIDVEAARRRLWREWQTLGDGPEEPLIDPLLPDGSLVRLHLRPYLAAQGDPAALLDAFVRTARESRGSVEALRCYWRVAERLATAGLLPYAPEALQRFFAAMQAKAFPTVHHSAVYTQVYRPAYRVIGHELPIGR